MNKPELSEIANKMVDAVAAAVARSEAKLTERMNVAIAHWEAKLAAIPAGERGEKGEPGKDAEVDIDMITASVRACVGALPAAKDGERGMDGRDGVDGKSVALADLQEFVEDAVAKSAAILKPKDGVDGKDGRDGKDGTSVHPDTIALMVREAADKVAASMPKPKDGRDGFSLEDFSMSLGEDGRTLSLLFTRGDVKVERSIKMETLIYREVWREGEYERGDVVTWGGSAWHCKQQTTDKPGTSSAWKMMVKEGRAGKDGVVTTPTPPKPVKV